MNVWTPYVSILAVGLMLVNFFAKRAVIGLAIAVLWFASFWFILQSIQLSNNVTYNNPMWLVAGAVIILGIGSVIYAVCRMIWGK